MKKFMIMVTVLLFTLTGCGKSRTDTAQGEELTVVTSFYPIYLMAQYVTEGAEGIVLENMAQPQTGCLHDYELTTEDMKLLERSDVFFMNGLGMESFLDQAREQNPQLYIVETGEHASVLLEGECEHDHAHGEEEEDPVNAHVWLHPENAILQAEAMRDALSQLDPKNAQLYEDNTKAFAAEMEKIRKEAEALAAEAPEVKTAAFHEGFIYLEDLLGMEEVIGIFPEENQTPSAKEMAEAVEEAKEKGVDLILTAEDAGEQYARLLSEETGTAVVVLNPLTSGNGDKTEFVDGMRANLEAVAQAYRGVTE
ncbi:zinc ABC transporter substrate-binding protein [Anaerotignum lactatifermentans]|uniref:Zinc ABC transporter substrate-binding protein n=1 Tax=Anaerotignum lactatifermentans TaxID=160404 RepID=A0ABS2G6G7_9FIRM|nr:metal ABC transporter substrate-binding protein [Anaerotignum lactatifermentans]MBM6828722.1 zinc ABC transporter substrate-binding protein [Anaerotignum lactatifermentans]MBM6877049.1 zinc ABC transporter substrate-binding protein [Anaerotignum lactatifermentans]MBM6950304.1 zinc ABC transporter substrate-binding protein [Anaerotignum lactatifermentans]